MKDRTDDAQPTNSPARYRNDVNTSCLGGLHGSPVSRRHGGVGGEEGSVEVGRDEHPVTLSTSPESVPVWVPSVKTITMVLQGVPAWREEGVRWRRSGRVLVADPRPEIIRAPGTATTRSHELLTALTPVFSVRPGLRPARYPTTVECHPF